MPPLLDDSLETLHVPALHSIGVLGDGYSVAVLDTGVNYEHPLLAGRLRAEGCFSTAESTVYSVASLCDNGLDVDLTLGSGSACDLPQCSHGTIVAGIAVGANGLFPGGGSISGVAPKSGLISVQVFTRFDDPCICGDMEPCIRSFTSDQLEALRYILSLSASHDIAAVNLSLGSGYYEVECDSTSLLSGSIGELRESGILTVIASGNDGYHNAVNSPACVSAAITVGWSYKDRVELGHPYSNTSALVDFLAPGTGVVSSTVEGYGPSTGTSMAAPHIAGLLALLKSRDPSASPHALESHLRSTARRTVDPRTGIVLYFPDSKAALDELVKADESSSVRAGGQDSDVGGLVGLIGSVRIIVSLDRDNATFSSEVPAIVAQALGTNVVVRRVAENTYSLERPAGFKLGELSRLAGELGPGTKLYGDQLAVPN